MHATWLASSIDKQRSAKYIIAHTKPRLGAQYAVSPCRRPLTMSTPSMHALNFAEMA